MKVAITGANGKVGLALIGQLDASRFEVTALDTPEHDASNLDDLIATTANHDALIHLAWKGLADPNINPLDVVDPINGVMYENAYRAATANNIGLVIMGSSNHARAHTELEADGKIRYSGETELANNIYGVEKQKMEAMGKYYAAQNDLRVLALRIGNVNTEDKRRPDAPTRWMSHRDLGRLVTMALDHNFPPGHFEIVYGVSRQPLFDWVNSFGYEPID